MRNHPFRFALLPWLLLVLDGCVGDVPDGELAPPPPDEWLAAPGDGVTFLSYPRQKTKTNAQWGAVLTDIEEHLPASYGSTYYDSDRVTHGHETTHGINSDLRNNYNDTGKRANGFYVLADRGVLVVEPNMRKSKIAAHVPASLRGPRFSLYITGQTAWDDMPTYVFDEWVAYTNGSAVAVDLYEAGKWTYGWRDGVAGTLEFTIYALATAMAVEQHDPTYFASNRQFHEFIAWNGRRAMDLYRRGAVMPPFQWDQQETYYRAIQESPDAEALRQFARRVYGDAWAHEVLGLPGGVEPEPEPAQPDAGGATPPPPPPPPPSGDADGDGIADGVDRCSSTPAGARVWTYGPWIGCAGGQRRDS